MAQSGTITKKATNYNNVELYWEVRSQDIEKNYSTIYYELRLTSGEYGAISSSVRKNYSVTIGGMTSEGTAIIDIGNNTTKILTSGTTSPYHNTDGSKTLNISFLLEFNITFNGTYINAISGSGTAVLPTIARVSSVTISNFVIEKSANISINRRNSAFTDTITATYKGTTVYIANKTALTSFKWTVPTTFYQLMPNKSSDYVTINWTTYSGNTVIGSRVHSVQMKVDNDLCKPTLAATVKDTNAATVSVTGNENVLVRYKSKASYSIIAEGKNYATIVKTVHPEGTFDGNLSGGAIENNEIREFNFAVTDSRGLTTTHPTITPTMIDYIIPTCNLAVKQPTPAAAGEATTTLNISGVMFNGSFGRATNTKIIEYRYKVNDGEYTQWAAVSATHTGNDYSATVDIGGLDYTMAYTFQTRARDNLHITESIEKTVRTTPVFDWGENDFNFNVPVKINNIEVDYIIEQGQSGNWRYRKWNGGTAELWYTTEPIETTTNTQWGSMYVTDAVFPTIQYPFTFVELPAITVTPQTAQGNFWLFTGGGGSVSYAPAFGVIRPNQSTVKAICNYYVIGRWKE